MHRNSVDWAVDWAVGDEIMVTSTSFDYLETEPVAIAAVRAAWLSRLRKSATEWLRVEQHGSVAECAAALRLSCAVGGVGQGRGERRASAAARSARPQSPGR